MVNVKKTKIEENRVKGQYTWLIYIKVIISQEIASRRT
jgi:hypothetical protein